MPASGINTASAGIAVGSGDDSQNIQNSSQNIQNSLGSSRRRSIFPRSSQLASRKSLFLRSSLRRRQLLSYSTVCRRNGRRFSFVVLSQYFPEPSFDQQWSCCRPAMLAEEDASILIDILT